MSKKNISQEKIIQAFISKSFEKSPGATSLSDIADILEIKKASLYNHFASREAMYDATLYHCGKEINSIRFLPEKALESIGAAKTTSTSFFKKLITRFFEMYENEPLFEIYAFIHTEQYFNADALKIVEQEFETISNDIKQILQALSDAAKIQKKSEKDFKEFASLITSLIFQQRDLYIAARKEILRQNPDCGVGSLFALPTDESSLNKTIKLVDNVLKTL